MPGLAPAAMQEGRWVPANIRVTYGSVAQSVSLPGQGETGDDRPGRRRCAFGKLHFSGPLRLAHCGFSFTFYFLVGFRNRLLVFIEWAWSYLTYQRAARLITGSSELPGWQNIQRCQRGRK